VEEIEVISIQEFGKNPGIQNHVSDLDIFSRSDLSFREEEKNLMGENHACKLFLPVSRAAFDSACPLEMLSISRMTMWFFARLINGSCSRRTVDQATRILRLFLGNETSPWESQNSRGP